MKTLTLLLFFVLSFLLTNVQAQSFRGLDKSPLDMAYFPDNFAHDREEGDQAIMRVIYSRPQKKNREIFGKKVAYGKVWRTGANEATEIKLYQDVSFEGKKLEKGVYALFTIPGEKEWTIIFNKDLDFWGAYRYNEGNDSLRVTAKASTSSGTTEAFTIQFEAEDDKKGVMNIAWDNTIVKVPFTY